jgi:hypothetical protein
MYADKNAFKRIVENNLIINHNNNDRQIPKKHENYSSVKNLVLQWQERLSRLMHSVLEIT